MLMVVLSHYFEWGETAITNKGLVHFMSSLGDPGVGIFFFLSGYALFKGYGRGFSGSKDAFKYFLGRFMGVYLPYLVIVGIITFINGGFSDAGSIKRYLIGSDYWFMAIIFVLYLSYGMFNFLPKYRTIIMSVFVFDLSFYLYLNDYAVFWYDAIWCFVLGLIISKYDEGWGFVKNGFCLNIKDYLFGFIGRISLYIYILHSFVYIKLLQLMDERGVEMNWYLRALIAFIITCICGYIFNIIFTMWKRGKKGERNS